MEYEKVQRLVNDVISFILNMSVDMIDPTDAFHDLIVNSDEMEDIRNTCNAVFGISISDKDLSNIYYVLQLYDCVASHLAMEEIKKQT